MTPRSRRPVMWLCVALAAALAAWFLLHRSANKADGAGRGHAHNQAHGAQADRQSVTAVPVTRGDIHVLMDGLGTVTPLATVTVRTQINGQLQQVAFTEGQMVRQGDFLAQIDPRPYQVALAQAQGALARDQALLKQAELDLARYRKLLSQDSIASQQVDTQASLVKQYQGTVVTDQAAIDSARLNLVYCHITAPVSGRVGLRQVDIGNYVQTSDTNGLVVLTQLQPISVIFALPEDDLPQIMAGQQKGSLPVTVYDRASTRQVATGALLTTDNQIDTTTGTVRLRAQFDNADNTLFPNQFVNARLLVDTHRNVVTVPSAAIQHGAPGAYVYVVQPDSTVLLRTVKTGPQDNDAVEITDGLQAGEQVVTDGADRLRDGAAVRTGKPKDDKAGTAQPAPAPAPAAQ